ncbi:carboxypeptidase-like regulatory domain-containing protein [Corallococcus terminator]|uniref:Carboxypeptidase regulatory-like domain-containing protein n=1 Tax=Corallococcus terminator TaxID=2316733 RepID=A0A3A8I6X4_9BACT|nr:carboxypeptidase-like regulatory domain-containing protein [Corallococcus terminator]RKG78308.1 hypothetical protein D7V88_29990 [Corallococcus terminator]
MRWSWVGLVVVMLACVGTSSQLPVTPTEASTAQPPEPAPSGALLTVVVRDAGGRPLSGIRFKVRHGRADHAQALWGRTDGSGRAQLRVASGWYVVSAVVPGYQSFVDTDVRLGRDHPATVTMTLQPGGRVSGRVVDASGAPLRIVWVAWVPGDETAPRVSAMSDSEGCFSLDGVGRGRGVLVSERPGFIRGRQVFESPPRDLKITLTATGKLRVRAVAPDGRAMNISDADLHRLDAGEAGDWSRVAADGVVAYEGLHPGRYRVATDDSPHPGTTWTVASDVAILPGQTQDAVLRFEGFQERVPLRGRVVGTDDRPLTGIPLIATSGDVKTGDRESVTRVMPDAQGRFVMEHLLQGPQRMTLSGADEVVQVAEDARDVSLVFHAPPLTEGFVEGRVLGPNGRPLTHFKVEATTFEDPRGRYSIRVPTTLPQVLTVSAEGFAPARLRVGALTSPRTVLPDVILDAGRKVRGQLLGLDGQPLPAGRDVTLVITRERDAHFSQDTRSARTDANGRFVMEHVPREAGILQFADEDAGTAVQPLGADQEEVTVRLVPDANLQATLADAQGRPLEGFKLMVRCQGRFGSMPTTDAEGHFTVRAPGGQPCVVKVLQNGGPSAWPNPPRRVFFPRQFVGAPGETLRMELRARTGTASLRVTLPTASEWFEVALVQGDVPLPPTLPAMETLVLHAIEPDPGASERRPEWNERQFVSFGRGSFEFSSLPLGHYTLFVMENREGIAVHRIPVDLSKPGVLDIASKLPEDGGAFFPR